MLPSTIWFPQCLLLSGFSLLQRSCNHSKNSREKYKGVAREVSSETPKQSRKHTWVRVIPFPPFRLTLGATSDRRTIFISPCAFICPSPPFPWGRRRRELSDCWVWKRQLGILDSALSSFLFGVCLLAESTHYRQLSPCSKGPVLEGGLQHYLWFSGWPCLIMRGSNSRQALLATDLNPCSPIGFYQ